MLIISSTEYDNINFLKAGHKFIHNWEVFNNGKVI